MQALVVSDPTLVTEVLQMPKVMDKNRAALYTLDTVSSVDPFLLKCLCSTKGLLLNNVCLSAD